MGVDGCPACLKYTMIVVNVFILIAGAGAIGLGAWSMISTYGSDTVKELTDSSSYKGVSISIITCGCLLFVLAFLGCCGAWSENKCMLGFYGGFMILFFILLLTAVVLAIVFKNKVHRELSLQLKKTLTKKYNVPLDKKDSKNIWDFIQKNLQCCGVEGNGTGNSSWFIWLSSSWYQQQKGFSKAIVPRSCCKTKPFSGECQKAIYLDPRFNLRDPGIYVTGCLDALVKKIEKNIGIVAGVCGAMLLILMLSAIVAFVICASIKS